MRYYLSAKVLDLGFDNPLHLASLAMVSDDDREMYAEWEGTPLHLANPEDRKMVGALDRRQAMHRYTIKQQVYNLLKTDFQPRFIGHHCAVDWTVFCQLFGRDWDLPPAWPRYCFDLEHVQMMIGNPVLPQKKFPHDSLHEAKWAKEVYGVMNGIWKKAVEADL